MILPIVKSPNNYGKDSKMSFNFFDWVRDGVKNSVLLGVSDAANTMGMPPDDSTKDKILGFLKSDVNNEPQVRRITNGTVPAGAKPKLGRSLSETMKEAS
jgi:hypothetical protein